MANKKKENSNSFDDEILCCLETCGIHTLSEDTVVTSENMTKAGYKEISNAYIERIGIPFQQFTGFATHVMSYSGTYRVYFDKSLGELQKAKQGDGFLRANVVQSGTNNKITGQALLKAASAGPLVANAVFSVLSMATGQYFISEINSELSQIQKNIDNIQRFLENEKRSELLANYYFLQQVMQTYEYIQSNEYQKQATVQQLQRIRIDSCANINFYIESFQQKKNELTNLKDNANTKKDIEKISVVINEIGNIICRYQFSLYTYSLSYYLEIMISGNIDSRLINYVKEDLKCRMNKYKSVIKYFSDEMNIFNEPKAFDVNALLKSLIGAVASQFLFGNPDLGVSIADAINSGSEAKKEKAIKEVQNQVNKLSKQFNEFEPFTQLENNLTDYDRIINKSKLELVCTGGKTYIRSSDIDDTEK